MENLEKQAIESPASNFERAENNSESLKSPEFSPKETPEKKVLIDDNLNQKIPADPTTPTALSKKRQAQIEAALSDGLGDIYLAMNPAKQAEFKKVGEETAGKIEKLLAKSKVNIKKIVDLIKKWLSIIPGVNKFFIEQEAKIKADKITHLH